MKGKNLSKRLVELKRDNAAVVSGFKVYRYADGTVIYSKPSPFDNIDNEPIEKQFERLEWKTLKRNKRNL